MNLGQVNIPVELLKADGLAKDHDAIQTITSKRTDHAIRRGALLWRAWHDDQLRDLLVCVGVNRRLGFSLGM